MSHAHAYTYASTIVILPNRLGERGRYGKRAWQLIHEIEPNERYKEQIAGRKRRAKRNINENGGRAACVNAAILTKLRTYEI